MQNNFRISNMSNFAEEFEEDTEEELQNTSLSQSYSASTTPVYGGNDHTFKPVTLKKKRNHPGNPDPNAEVVALSPRTLMARNTYVCEVCHKGFQRDQNLQLHRRGHNLPWKLKLKQKSSIEARKKVYICPEQNCVHHDPSRALGDLTGIKKHFCRKHGEKKWKCEKCAKRYAVQSDWKAHMKICGTREYHCDCGTIFSRKDSFVTHRAFCDALAIENYRVTENLVSMGGMLPGQTQELFSSSMLVPNMSLAISNQTTDDPMRSLSLASGVALSTSSDGIFDPNKPVSLSVGLNCLSGGSFDTPSPYMSATALLQKATEMGSKVSDSSFGPSFLRGFTGYSSSTMSSNGSLQEISCMVNHTTNTDSYVGNQNVFEHDLEQPRSMDIMQDSGAFNRRYMDSPLAVVHSKIGETTNMLRGDSNGGGEKMTVDFLGVGAAGHLISEEDKSCDMDTIGLTYSERQHMYSEWLSRPS